MVRIIPFILLLFATSCSDNQLIVETAYVDSLITNYTPSVFEKSVTGDVDFWQKRFASEPTDFVSQGKYVQGLVSRFHIYYDIHDLRTADSIIGVLHKRFPDEQQFLLSSVYTALLQHRFITAKQIMDTAMNMKAKTFATQMLMYDLNFELGNMAYAKTLLLSNKKPAAYAYNFRLAKLDHYNGEMDSAIRHIIKAASIATEPSLKQAALSNAADFYTHTGKLQKAYELYKTCLNINSSDFHSLTRIGWLALVGDGNDSTAKKVFEFVRHRTKSPDPILKLCQATELKDSNAAKQYAMEFVKVASDSLYGNMYNKYLIEIYTGILKDPATAVAVANRELKNRCTPQTYAWLAWSLTAGGKTSEAYQLFKQKISGKPLEGLELYWMGKLMKMVGKQYNARQFFKEAEKNKYDLSPAIIKDLKKNLQ